MIISKSWFGENKNGKIQINSRIIYRELSPQIIEKLNQNLSVSHILNWMRHQTTEAFRTQYKKNLELGALNKVVGDWNEFIATSLLSEIVIDKNKNQGILCAVFSLPSSRLQKEGNNEVSSKFLSLFSNKEFTNKESLSKIAFLKNQIFLSSPDYIIVAINRDKFATTVQILLEQQLSAPDSFAVYDFFKGKLQAQDLKAVASLKTSNRPDRRYQPLFEAAMVKAMGYVLQQNWQYYMVTSKLSSADRTIFSTAVAPHGIALEQNFNLVDGTYLYNRKEDLVPLIESAIQQ
ncbi:MAG TPA: deoxyribose-phosphate aldolase [Cyanobacteria bacterium UBA8803]|nr:deoxyribose-phosphate aldolase [Cyanobacteria bacterium UBA9273]HBL61852.1 deoxyribose-phosphate aldolase [Cyanobacteria bacterium UBA8803]